MKTGQENPKQWTPPEDAVVASNGNAVIEKEWSPPADAVLKKKDLTERNLNSESESKTQDSGVSSKPVSTDVEDLPKPTEGPINDLQKRIEQARTENIEKVQNTALPAIPGLGKQKEIKLGQPGKGLSQLAAEHLNKDLAGQKESLDFLSKQQQQLEKSIANSAKLQPVQQDVTRAEQPVKPTAAEMAATDQQTKDQLANEARAKAEVDTGLGPASSAAGKFDQGVVKIATDVLLRTPAIAAAKVIGGDATEDVAYKLADWIDRKTKEAFPDNPAYQGEFWADTVPQTAATLFSFMIGGALGKTTKLAELTMPSATKLIMEHTAEHIPAAFMASASTAADEYDAALKKTGDQDTAKEAWERNLFTGVPFLISPTFKAFDKATDGAIKYGIKQAAIGGPVGMFQMASSHVFTNLSAQQTYDKTREIMDGVVATGGSGFAINAVLTGLLGAITHKAAGASPTEKAKYEQTVRAVQEQQAKTSDLGNTDYYQEPGLREESGMYHTAETPAEVITTEKADIKSSGDTAAVEKAAEVIQKKINETPEEGVQNDRENKSGIQGDIGEGKEFIKAEPEQSGSPQAAGSGRVVQESPEVVNEKTQTGGTEAGRPAAVPEVTPQETIPPANEQNTNIEPQEAKVETSPEGTQPVFVYGTLRDAKTREKALGEKIGTEKTEAEGEAKKEGEFSTIVPSEGKKTEGEVMQLTPKQIKKLAKAKQTPRPEATAGEEPNPEPHAQETQGGKEGQAVLTPEGSKGEALPNQASPASPSGEPPAPPEQASLSEEGNEEKPLAGIKKALVPEEKVEEMEPKLENRTNEEFLAQGKKDVESGDINPVALVNDVVEHHRALQTHEVAALVYYKAKLDNRFDAVNQVILKNKAEGGNPVHLRLAIEEAKVLEQARDQFHEMQLITAREQGRAFGLRKMLLDNEYNLQSQINQYKANSADGEIPPDVEAKFKEIDKKLKDANARIAELEKTAAERQDKETMGSIEEEVRKERKKPTREKRGKVLMDEGFADLKNIFSENKMGAVFDPKRAAREMLHQDRRIVAALEKIGKGLLDEGLATIENVATKIKEYVEDKFSGKIKFEKYEKEILEKITAGIPKPTIKNGKLRIPKSMIHDFVESGIDNIEDLTKAIHAVVKREMKDVTERQVRDAITDYGKTSNLNSEEIATKIRELKRVGKLISGLEDVRKKLRPLRSGLQRDALTDKERVMQRELKEAMKDLPEDAAETARVWKTSLEATKTRLKNQITDLEDQIKTGKKTPKKKGIEYDQEAKMLVAKRDQLKEELAKTDEKQGISDQQRLRQAVANAEKTLKEYERRVKEGDFEKKEKRPGITNDELIRIRQQRDLAKQQYDKVREELGIAEKERLTGAKESVRKSMEEYQRRVKEGDFSKRETKKYQADSELEKAMIERDKAKFEFEVAQEKNRLENRPMSQKTKDFMIDMFNVPKSLISSVDLSAPLRQGFLLSVAHPGSARKAFSEMFKQMASAKYQENWLAKLRQNDIYPLIRSSKLYVSEPHAKLSAREENFVSHIVNKIPGIGRLVKGSERAYSGYLNALRVDVFAKGVDALKDTGYSMENNPKAFKDWAAFVNNASGRGNLGAFERSATILNTVFFSPRFLASRLNVLNPVTYAKMDPAVRRMAMKDTLAYIAFGTTILGMAAAAGAEVETDPRSTDFGKIKIGNTRYDIWAGFQPIVRVISQLASGQTKSASGEINDLNSDKWGARTRTDVIGTFLRGKEAPAVSAVHNLLSGKNIIGQKVTPLSELERNVLPLYLQDIYSIYQNEGVEGAATIAVPALFGVGVQNYQSAKPKSYKQIIRDALKGVKGIIPQSGDIRKMINQENQ